MNTTIETATRTATAPTKRRGPAPVATPAPSTAAPTAAVELLDKRPASERTRLVYMALLGMAACVALIGVVSQATATGTSPDDPAPAVIVSFD